MGAEPWISEAMVGLTLPTVNVDPKEVPNRMDFLGNPIDTSGTTHGVDIGVFLQALRQQCPRAADELEGKTILGLCKPGSLFNIAGGNPFLMFFSEASCEVVA